MIVYYIWHLNINVQLQMKENAIVKKK